MRAAARLRNKAIEAIAMHGSTKFHTRVLSGSHLAGSIPDRVMRSSALLAITVLAAGSSLAQSPVPVQASPATSAPPSAIVNQHPHRLRKKAPAPAPVAETPPPPPMPHWPINDGPNAPSVVWDSSGLRISASNSSLQQILKEVSTDTGTKVVGAIPDQRVFGNYGPGDARDVLSQLLQGSGYNILFAGDLGKGAPTEIVLTPRRAGSAGAPAAVTRPQQPEPEEDVPDQPEEEPQPQVQPQTPSDPRANTPVRTPQQVMEEMQRRQLLQQQQQANPAPPQPNPQ